MKSKRIRSNHNNLLNYFICDRRDLSPEYVRKCEKYFKKIKKNLKVSSSGGPALKSPSARKQEIC